MPDIHFYAILCLCDKLSQDRDARPSSGEECDLACVRLAGVLLKCLAQTDGRAVDVEGDGWVSVTGVLNPVQTYGV